MLSLNNIQMTASNADVRVVGVVVHVVVCSG